jgi:hypothetical protein
MFVIQYEDGTLLSEGKDVESWDGVPYDGKRIAAVTLTAGGQLHKTIMGYDEYVVSYEAVAKLEGRFCTGVEDVNWTPKPSAGTVIGQVCVGYRRFPEWIKELQKQWAENKITLEENARDSCQPIVKRLLMQEYQRLNLRMPEIMDTIKDREVGIITLGFSERFTSRRSYPVPRKCMRPGVPMPIDPSPDEIRARLLSK